MTDQLSHLPPSLPGALISSAQTSQESSATISRLRAGQAKVLVISPEREIFSESFLSILGELPKISLAVIDEAHCLSEWWVLTSYNGTGFTVVSEILICPAQ
jgi:ATP-dependent DNA helicase Q4